MTPDHLELPTGSRLVGRGRTCDVYALGVGRVLRRYRDGRDAAREATAMQALSAAGAPVPAVYDAAGPDIVMDRLSGPTLLAHALRRPWRTTPTANLLRRLLADVAATPPVPGLRTPFGPGPATLHLDLHPGNVVLSPDGPVIIDWDNVAQGPAETDVVQTWLLIRVSEAPLPAPLRAGLQVLQRRLARAVLPDDDPARTWLAPVLRRRLDNVNLTALEDRRIRTMLAASPAGLDDRN